MLERCAPSLNVFVEEPVPKRRIAGPVADTLGREGGKLDREKEDWVLEEAVPSCSKLLTKSW